VRLDRVPNGGIQPQIAVAANGIVHLVYFSGDPSAGHLFYASSTDGGFRFSNPMRVNSHPGSAIAVGNIRGAHVALGRNRRVHMAWNGSKQAKPKGPNAEPKGPDGAAPMLYACLNDEGTQFEPERNVIQAAYALDGGGALAADQKGNVHVFFHAQAPGTTGEGNRRVWVARSTYRRQDIRAGNGRHGSAHGRVQLLWNDGDGRAQWRCLCSLSLGDRPGQSRHVRGRIA